MAELLKLKGSLTRQKAQLVEAEAKLKEVHRQQLLLDSTVQEAQEEERELAGAGIDVVLDRDLSAMKEDEAEGPEASGQAGQKEQDAAKDECLRGRRDARCGRREAGKCVLRWR